ncbi:MAG: hypothetical protein NE327_17455 [Lentisphaeraceae bacterium]|nr:hypothetical protein [Lentisphaeraceae bacterium]
MKKYQFNLFRNNYYLGIIHADFPFEETSPVSARIELRMDIIQSIGWEATRYSKALKALEEFILFKERTNLSEKELLQSAEYLKLCNGEIGHYLFEGTYFISNRFENHFEIELNSFKGDSIQFKICNQLDKAPCLTDYTFLDSFQSLYDFTLVKDPKGLHKFGGSNQLKITGLKQDVHLTFLLNLKDSKLPLISKDNITKLPLLYCFHSTDDFQYELVSENEVNIIYMESFNEEMITSSEFPSVSFSIKELTYEEKRMRSFHAHPLNSGLNNEDNILWSDLGGNTPFLFCGKPQLNQGSVSCLNANCDHKESIDLLFTLVPFKIEDDSSFWEEWDSEYIDICFYICRGCKNIIVRNSTL